VLPLWLAAVLLFKRDPALPLPNIKLPDDDIVINF
jgi:hypothetical protein